MTLHLGSSCNLNYLACCLQGRNETFAGSWTWVTNYEPRFSETSGILKASKYKAGSSSLSIISRSERRMIDTCSQPLMCGMIKE